jgi:hypothetical protein
LEEAFGGQNFAVQDDDAELEVADPGKEYEPYVYPEDFTQREGAQEVAEFLARDDYRLNNPLRNLQVPDHILNPDYNHDNEINVEPNTKMREEFRAYCANARANFREIFTKSEARAVKLLHILRQKRAPLDTYDEIMDWHHRVPGDFDGRESVESRRGYLSRAGAMKFLQDRYNMKGKSPEKVVVKLPFAGAKVTITRHNAWDCIQSLLTDPRVTDDDYNFIGQDPFKAPERPQVIGELNTAQCYYAAYQQYITKPNQVLLPIIMYIDGAATGQFRSLPITALKVALGIHTRQHRDRPHAWRNLGYVPPVNQPTTRGTEMYAETGHLDADDPGDLGGIPTYQPDILPNQPACKAQDFHTILDVMLESYRDVQKNGFMWDFRYRGKTHKDVEVVPFLMFIKCDTDEADVLCGAYKSRTEGVAQLCRYCCCPTLESDRVLAKFPEKTTPMLSFYVETGDTERLKKMSQHVIRNAWHKIRFGPHNSMGVHGATPSEMLHAILLGLFQYIRTNFFQDIGPTSQLGKEIEALAQKYGEAFGRQSERDLPKCKFGEGGIRRGKRQAKEYRGILLVIAVILRSTKGREILSTNNNFAGDNLLNDWIKMVELFIQWEAYLNEPTMRLVHVLRLDHKIRYMMYLLKRVSPRETGMGWKIMKFHVNVHMATDIRFFGVPLEHNTGSNESGHKETKAAASLTQKNQSTFDYQTCTRLDEFMAIDLAHVELTSFALWKYYERQATPPPKGPPAPDPPTVGGARINIFLDPLPSFSQGLGKQAKTASKVEWSKDVLAFLWQLQQKLPGKTMSVRPEYKTNELIYRGNPFYKGKHWRDWAMFDWGGELGLLPGHIWCFVVIDGFNNAGATVQYGGIDLEDGIFAVVERAYFVEDQGEIDLSSIFLPIKKKVGAMPQGARGWKRQFYLANVKTLDHALAVVPDIGGHDGVEYFIVIKRGSWANHFCNWLRAPSANDIIGPDEPVPIHAIRAGQRRSS